MNENKEPITLSCSDCAVVKCASQQGEYPSFCLTKNIDLKIRKEVINEYNSNEDDAKFIKATAEVAFASQFTFNRVKETMEVAKRMGYKKIGIATCVALIKEAKVIAQILRKNGFEPYTVACKVSATKKTELRINEEYIAKYDQQNCNPIMQAKLLEQAGCEFNIAVGLCVGHDSLFYKYSKAPVTTMIVKDVTLGHNPIAAIYTADRIFTKLL